MDRAFQLREQHLRRHRLILAIYFLALLVFLSIIIGLLVKYALGRNDRDRNSDGDVVQIEGSWGDWLPWSQCSVTCGGGLQSRRRFCDDPRPRNNGSHCDGSYDQRRACSSWLCPDCSRYCEVGFLRECAYCKCMGHLLQGRVSDMESVPLYGVSIYISHMQWKPLVTTNPQGSFILDNICTEDLVLVFRKDGYRTAEVNATTVPEVGGYVSVSLEKLRQPRLIKYPIDTVAFEGETIALSCLSDFTHRAQYEWYKNANILSHPNERPGMTSLATAHAPELIISNIRKGDAGIYRCRTINDVGEKTFSNPALMKVVGMDEVNTCHPDPLPKYLFLPEGCSHGNRNSCVINIGSCPAEVCRTRPVSEEGGKIPRKCCGAMETETIIITCEGWSFPVVKTKQCGCTKSCGESYKIPVTGHAILRDLLYGTEKKLQTTFSHDGQVVTTDENGRFLLSVYSNQTRTVLSVPPNPFPDPYDPDLRVLHHPGTMHHFDILLHNKASPVRIESSQTMEFPVMSVGMTSLPVVSITLPGGTVMEEDTWRPYNGTMDVFTAFLDTRLKSNIESIPGDYTYRNEEGEIYQLEIYGVIIFYIEDPDGNTIEANTEINIFMDISEINVDHEKLHFWTLDGTTARWRQCRAQIAKPEESSGKSLQARVEINPGMKFIAIARSLPNRHRCEVKVTVYNNDKLTETLPGQLVNIISKHDGIFIHKNQELTGLYGNVCIQVPCGCEHHLSVFRAHTTKFHNLPAGYKYENSADATWVIFNSPQASEFLSVDGPIHRHGGYTCLDTRQGARPYQFEFIKDKVVKSTVAERGILTMSEPKPGKINSWFEESLDSPDIAACAIKLTLEGVSNRTEVIAVSRRDNIHSHLYGTHVASTFDPSSSLGQTMDVCFLVRCPTDEIKATNKTGHVNHHVSTQVQIHIVHGSTRECDIIEQTENEGMEWSEKQQTQNQTLNLILSRRLETNTGGFFMNRGNGEATSDWVLLECSRSKRSAVKLDCG